MGYIPDRSQTPEEEAEYTAQLISERNKHNCSECGKPLSEDSIAEQIDGYLDWWGGIDENYKCKSCSIYSYYTSSSGWIRDFKISLRRAGCMSVLVIGGLVIAGFLAIFLN